MTQPIPAKQAEKVSKQQIVETLVVEGHIMFTDVDSVDNITDERIISASHNVIKELAQQKAKLLNDVYEYQDTLNRFYQECARNNVIVSRDKDDKIILRRI